VYSETLTVLVEEVEELQREEGSGRRLGTDKFVEKLKYDDNVI